jgi:hypothetical protein
MTNTAINHKAARELDEQGVPRPDGTPLGNLRHTIAVYEGTEDDRVVLMATSGIYGETTGLTLGDLRALLRSLEIG